MTTGCESACAPRTPPLFGGASCSFWLRSDFSWRGNLRVTVAPRKPSASRWRGGRQWCSSPASAPAYFLKPLQAAVLAGFRAVVIGLASVLPRARSPRLLAHRAGDRLEARARSSGAREAILSPSPWPRLSPPAWP
jgi:hypothetical protein